MDAIEPLISTSVKGPLGIAHLPRLWLKILLHAAGRLPEGYRHGEGGFDGALCEQLGIDREALVAYVEHEKPEYPAFEKWVAAHATQLTPTRVAAWNLHVTSANLRPERVAEWRGRFGLEDPDFAHGVSLNDLDDWAGIHKRLTAP